MIEFSCKINYENYKNYFLFTQKKTFKIFKISGLLCIIFGALYAIITFTPPIVLEELTYDIFYSIVIIGLGLFFVLGMKNLFLKNFNNSFYSNKYLQSTQLSLINLMRIILKFFVLVHLELKIRHLLMICYIQSQKLMDIYFYLFQTIQHLLLINKMLKLTT